MPDLPEPARIPTPPGAVLVLRGDAAPWDGNPEQLIAALAHLRTETGCPVVFIDTAADDGLELSASLPEEAERALAGELFEEPEPDAFQLLAARRKLTRLRNEGWQLVRVLP